MCVTAPALVRVLLGVGTIGGAENGFEEGFESRHRGGRDGHIDLGHRPDGELSAVPEEVAEFSIAGEVV